MSERGSPSRSRSRSAGFAGSRSRSGSRRESRSRSRSEPRRDRSGSAERPKRRDSRSPMSDRRRHPVDREEPEPNKCLGVFGLSLYTTERELEKEFGRFGPLEKTQVVLDGHSGRSRGFAFVYYENIKDATAARAEMNSLDLDGRKIRVDYSITKRPHTPTPGMYMGRPTDARGGDDRGRGRGGGRGRGDRGGYRGGPPRHFDDRGPPPRHYDDRGPPPRVYDDRDRYHGGGGDRYGPPPRHYDDRGPPPRHYDDRGPPPRHYDDRGPPPRYYEERGYGGRESRGGADRYAAGGSSHGTRRQRSPSPYYREQRPRRDYRSRSRSYERPRY